MLVENFINSWSILAKRMGVRLSDEYIDWNSRDMGVDRWDESIVRELVSNISRMNPKNLDLSAENLKRNYWDIFRNRQKTETVSEKTPCTHKLCNGKGLIKSFIPKGSLLPKSGDLPQFVTPREYECFFACDCIKGQDISATRWSNRDKRVSYNLDQDYIYTDKDFRDDKEENQEFMGKFNPQIVDKIAERMNLI